MIKIEVVSTVIEEKSGTSGKGKPYLIREQVECYAHVLDKNGKPGRYPVLCKLPLEEHQAPYQPGLYTLDPRAVYVGDYGRLALGGVKLVPLGGEQRKAA